MCTKKNVLVKNAHKLAALIEKGQNSIPNEVRSGRFQMASMPDVVDSVNGHFSPDRSYNGGHAWTTWNLCWYTKFDLQEPLCLIAD